MVHRVTIPRWRPATINRLFGKVMRKIQLKRQDRDLMIAYCLKGQIPKATGPRMVSLHITLGPQDRPCDMDAPWKGLFDGLVKAGMLIDDAVPFVRIGDLTFEKGKQLATTIILEDL